VSRGFASIVVGLRWLIVPAWIVAGVVAFQSLPRISGVQESTLGGLVPEHASAIAVEQRAFERFRTPVLSRVLVVQRNPNGLERDEQARVLRRAGRIDDGSDQLLHSVAFALPILNTAGVFPGAREDGTTAITYLYFRSDVSFGARIALAHTYARRIAEAGDPLAGVTGALPARQLEFESIDDHLNLVEGATIAVIALILLLTFRSVGAPLVTLGAAAIAYAISTGAVAWIGERRGVSVPQEVKPVIVALLLGLMTDYTVFFFSGVRQRLSEGRRATDAAREATGLYAPIVLTAGLIVAFGAATLVVGKLSFFRAFGPGMAVTVIVTLAVALTFVPAALALLGRTVFWPGLSRAPHEEGKLVRLRRRLARVATLRSVALLLAAGAIAVLVIGALQVRHTALGFSLIRGLPADSEANLAADAAERGFARGIVSPTLLLLERRGLGGQRPALARLQSLLAHERGVAAVLGPAQQPRRLRLPVFVNARGDAARLVLVLDRDPFAASGIDVLRRIERDLPRFLDHAGLRGVQTGLAGDTALAAETVDAVRSDTVRIAAAALAVNLIFLVLFLRALVVPLLLLAVSVLALGAALGITTYVFQDQLGHVDLTYYVPLAAAVLLLSLGSDYNVFVVGRIWQESRRMPLREAIALTTPRTARTIAIAGVALACSFAMLALVPIRPMREFAFVMAVGLLLDTFLVRPLLVPALVTLAGDAGRWPGRRHVDDERGRPGGRPREREAAGGLR
jgi:RND superfamily putative drug exporter